MLEEIYTTGLARDSRSKVNFLPPCLQVLQEGHPDTTTRSQVWSGAAPVGQGKRKRNVVLVVEEMPPPGTGT
jgi:hypothetical protein